MYVNVSGTHGGTRGTAAGTQTYGAGGVTVQAEVLEIVTDNITTSDTPFYEDEKFWMMAGPVTAVVVLCASLLACYCCCGSRPAKEGDILFDHISEDNDHGNTNTPADMFTQHYNTAFTSDMSAEELAYAERAGLFDVQVEEPGTAAAAAAAAGVDGGSELGHSGSEKSAPVRRIRRVLLSVPLWLPRHLGSSL
jgi:hypothetical protein